MKLNNDQSKLESSSSPSALAFSQKHRKVILRALVLGFLILLSGLIFFGHKLNFRNLVELKIKQIIFIETNPSNLSTLITKKDLFDKSALKIGEPLMKVDLGNVENKILQIPWIESVRIQRKMPSEIEVHYTPHEVKGFTVEKKKIHFVSSEGIVLAEAEKPYIFDMPLFVPSKRSSKKNSTPKNFLRHIHWLSAIQQKFDSNALKIHEIKMIDNGFFEILAEVFYSSSSKKIKILCTDETSDEIVNRLYLVVQYLVKANMFVNEINLRFGKKVVVNVGFHT